MDLVISTPPYPILPYPPYFTDSISMTSARLLRLLLCIGAHGFIARICHPWEWFPSRSCWLPLFQWKAKGIWVKVKNLIPPTRQPTSQWTCWSTYHRHTTDTCPNTANVSADTPQTCRSTHHQHFSRHTTNAIFKMKHFLIHPTST